MTSGKDIWAAKEAELKAKERVVRADLDDTQRELGGRVKTVLIWAVVAGVIMLVLYGIYNALFGSDKKKKKKKKHRKDGHEEEASPAAYPEWLSDDLVQKGASALGSWLVKQLK
jgi:hypothetical protein